MALNIFHESNSAALAHVAGEKGEDIMGTKEIEQFLKWWNIVNVKNSEKVISVSYINNRATQRFSTVTSRIHCSGLKRAVCLLFAHGLEQAHKHGRSLVASGFESGTIQPEADTLPLCHSCLRSLDLE
ncbi:hypothetical protein AVEN_240617-1 [Araneus ventricosus]|uniref:Uncharacterized protein n=1 Tax=Araneus ventricosus TaxID=182803 RepID=A0A4Y2D5U1_ARAVE|nr:hypothetical protein AVEN_240617-1 [Araneus ventricosus]